LQLPGLQTTLSKAYFLSDPTRVPLHIDNGDGDKSITVPKAHETAPVIVVVAEYDGKLSVIPPTTKPDQNGRLVLADKEADHFLNYNGEGYYDRPTVYKEQWAAALEQGGRYRLEIVFDKPQEARRVDVIVEGRRIAATLDGKNADEQNTGESRATVGIVALEPSKYFPVEITPPEPFTKGQKLGVKITRIELTHLPEDHGRK
jgi:alpha-L-fucosidase